ncbi:hypothetical protein GCM10011323_17570 [Pontibacter amylolyticus]|uniref:PH domain-containing protein n=2 Tax=Pontibacter amylolyticus TaxID=1424080 RepID=A0ABQ1W3Q9_9BACT|nr:hypothetical protein GCM10011323_17570 [Pontibacter amylolyticus]
MKKDKDYKLKIIFPYEAILALLFFSFLLVVCIWQYSLKGEYDYLIIALGVIIAMCSLGWLFNYNYKSLVIRGEAMKVKYWLGLNSKTLKRQDIKGYKFKETYTRHGLDYYITLVPLEGKEIVFIRDSYANYERLEFYLKKYGVFYIGTENINSPYKKMLARITVWGSVISAMLFLLLQLLKWAK